MAPDRGSDTSYRGSNTYKPITSDDSESQHTDEMAIADVDDEDTDRQNNARQFLAERADEGQNFTVRGVLVGLAIGVIICFSNTYFGLQTGWISGMAMPAALIGFAFFKTISKYISYPFTPVENVLVQTVAGAVGTMPLGCGFVGVLPALNFMLTPEENGPLVLGIGKLIVWAVGICFFGVFIAAPLRREVIIREKLKFPSGTATALMIGVVHGSQDDSEESKQQNPMEIFERRSQDARGSSSAAEGRAEFTDGEGPGEDHRGDWKAKIRLLIIAFAISAVYVR